MTVNSGVEYYFISSIRRMQSSWKAGHCSVFPYFLGNYLTMLLVSKTVASNGFMNDYIIIWSWSDVGTIHVSARSEGSPSW